MYIIGLVIIMGLLFYSFRKLLLPERLVIILAAIMVYILLMVFIIRYKTRDTNNFSLKLSRNFFKENALALIVASPLLIIGLGGMVEGLVDYSYQYVKDESYMPDFVINITDKNTDLAKLEEVASGHSYYPVIIAYNEETSDKDFKEDFAKLSDGAFVPFIGETNIMSASMFEKLFNIKLQETLRGDEAIYAMGVYDGNEASYDKLVGKLFKNSYTVDIEDKTYEIKTSLRYKQFFSNYMGMLDNVFIISDADFESTFPDLKPYAYNIDLNKDFINKYGYKKALALFKAELDKLGLTYTSDQSFIVDPTGILMAINAMLALSLIIFVVSNIFIGLIALTYLNANMKNFKIIRELGASLDYIKLEVKSFINLIFLTLLPINLGIFTLAISSLYQTSLRVNEFLPMLAERYKPVVIVIFALVLALVSLWQIRKVGLRMVEDKL